MVFAWTQAKNVPLLLGRINFFQEFDVCFYGSQLVFEIAVKLPIFSSLDRTKYQPSSIFLDR
jgi:hypothetical protein